MGMLFWSDDDEHNAQILIILPNIFHIIKHMDRVRWDWGGGGAGRGGQVRAR